MCVCVLAHVYEELDNKINEIGHVNLASSHADNIGADQPAQPCSLISTFDIRSLASTTKLVS